MDYKLVRGMKDISSQDSLKFYEIIDIATKISLFYNFQNLILPVVEFASLFERNLGSETDINQKELYKFYDKGNELLALRPEFTASVARFVINSNQDIFPKRFFSYGPLFRYDRPQKGRYRTFYQVNFESFFNQYYDLSVEIENQLNICVQILQFLNISSYTIKINHLCIDKEARNRYIQELKSYLEKNIESLSEKSKERLIKNPLRILDSKEAEDRSIIQNAPKINSFYNNDEDILLKNISTKYHNIEVDHNLVRGLDYYTGFIFEINSSENNYALFGGGEYSNLISTMTNGRKNLTAIGFAGGIDRLMIETQSKTKSKPLLIFIIDKNIKSNIFHKIYNNVSENFQIDLIFDKNIKKSFEKAIKLKPKAIIIKGENESANNTIVVKNIDTAEQKTYEDVEKNIELILNSILR